MLSARGMVTSTVSTLKDKLAIFKKNAREILPKLKQKIGKRFTELKQKLVRAFNDVIDYFSRNKQASSIYSILNEELMCEVLVLCIGFVSYVSIFWIQIS